MKSARINYMALSLMAAASLVYAQDRPTNGGWRRVGDPANPNYSTDQNSQSQATDPNRPAAPQQDPNYYRVPPQLTIRPGTYVTVRVNQPLSSDRNQPGDAFSATLVRPIVVDGVVVAERGQTLGGRVAEARKVGRVEGVSRLGVQLIDLPLVDGQQVPIHSELVSRAGPTSVGRDAEAVMGTTALGAAVGAAVDWGRGAAIGAAAGAVAGMIGVLATRGHETVIYPESVLTFRIESPVTISTDRAPQAYRYVDQGDYDRPYDTEMRTRPPAGPCGAYGCPPPAPYYYGAPYYPYYFGYGSGFGYFYGPRFYGTGFFFSNRGGFHGGFRGGRR